MGLLELEKTQDEEMRKLRILSEYINFPFSLLFNTVDHFQSGGRGVTNKTKSPDTALDLLSRFSYLEPLLLSCVKELGGTNAREVLNYLNESELKTDAAKLVRYLHLCEVVPQFRKGHLVERVSGKRIELNHPNDDFKKIEKRDIIFAELASATLVDRLPPPDYGLLKEAVKNAKVNMALTMLYAKSKFDAILRAQVEDMYFDESEYLEVFGFESRDYKSVRAAILSICAVYGEVAYCLEADYANTQEERYYDEMLEFVSVGVLKNFFYACVMVTSQVSESRLLKVLSWLELDVRKIGGSRQSGDGYTPPLILLGDSVLFNPFALVNSFSIRNILYSYNQRDPDSFGAIVANKMEPFLIDEALSVLSDFSRFESATGVAFAGGEIDLVLYSQTENIILNVQAKAPLSPQGARMVTATETRVKEGLAQLSRFTKLSVKEREEVYSKAFNREISAPQVVDCILIRSCVGTKKIWDQLGDTLLFNLPILRMLQTKFKGNSLNASEFVAEVNKAINFIDTGVNYQWKTADLDFGGVTLCVPSLDRDGVSSLHLVKGYR